MGKRVLLIVNRDKPDAADAEAEISTLIEAHGTLVDVLPAESSPAPDVSVDVVVVLGGDGTLLSQSRRFLDAGLPMLGVNFGRLGILAQFDLASLHTQAKRVFGEDTLEMFDVRPLLVRVWPDGDRSQAPAFQEFALNDGVITAGPPYRMISMEILFGDVPGPSVSGDGLIVSTPLGSTAYCVSAGGPIVAPSVDAMVITPIAAHSLAFRPIVVNANEIVSIRLDRVNNDDAGGQGGTTLVLDGQMQHRLAESDLVEIRRDPRLVSFVRNSDATYWKTLLEKMHWAVAPKARGDS